MINDKQTSFTILSKAVSTISKGGVDIYSHKKEAKWDHI
jgi:hypothetical protein